MNEFDSFFVYISEVIYEMDQDREELIEFHVSARKHLGRLIAALARTKDKRRIRAARRNIGESKRYVARIEKEIRSCERKLKKLRKFAEEIKKMKLVAMSRIVQDRGATMPIYEFLCPHCKKEIEGFFTAKETREKEGFICPHCGEEVTWEDKLVSGMAYTPSKWGDS